MKTTIKQFTPGGRAKFAEYVMYAQNNETKLIEDEINKLVLDDTYTTSHNSNTIDSNEIFSDRFSMIKYIADGVLIKDREKWHDEIFSNWGLLEWLAAFYHKQIMKPDNDKRSGVRNVTAYNFLIMSGARIVNDEEKLGTFASTITSRHGICFYLYYYSKYLGKLRFLLGDKPYRASEITEQLFAGMEDRLSNNLLEFINERAAQYTDNWANVAKKIKIKSSTDVFGARNIVKLETCIRNAYHPESMEYTDYKKKLIELSELYNS